MPSQLTGGSKTSIYLYQALFGQAPGASLLSAATANATANTVAFANELGAGFNAVPTATFVAGVMANLGLSSTYAGFSAGGYAGLQAALVQYYDAAGVANRGYVTLQLASLLTDSAHERDATYGSAATNFINQTAANYNYASVSTNVASTAVPVAPVVNLALTTGADSITGTAGNDLFLAWISNNANTLQSGDVIDGGLGVNRLEADIGNSQSFAITASTKNVQTVAIRGEANASDSNNNNMSGTTATAHAVQIDAQRMVGVTQWESNNSRADVVIEDVRINANQITKDITIAMVETDPGHVDFGVYFDQLSLRNVSTSTSQLNLQVMDTRSVVSGTAPLLNSPYAGFVFTSTNAAGVATVVTLQSTAIDNAQTYAELVTAYQAAANTVFGAGVVTVTLGKSFTVTDTTTGTAVTGNEITISAAGAFTFTTPTGSGFIATGVVPANSGLHTNFNTAVSASTELVTSKIILDDVGRGSTSGDLVVGGLSVGDTSSSLGVQRFEIEVRDNSKLESINSTNNTLKEVTIVNGITTSSSFAYGTTVANAGNLTVNGNSGANGANVTNGNATDAQTGQNAPLAGSAAQTARGFGFSDVRLIDASAMTGQLAFSAEVTSASIAKYLNLQDVAPSAAAADNVAFTYTGGVNNDTMVIQIDGGVAASRSTIMAGREDFTFTANGGAGNDSITLNVIDGLTGTTQAWYANQKLNANIAVNGGDGNDTIRTPGAGDVKIDAGAGNDVVFTDNTGRQLFTADTNLAVNSDGAGLATDDADVVNSRTNAIWVYGTTDQTTGGAAARTVSDLLSSANTSYAAFKTKLTVTFKGLTASTVIAGTNYATTDLEINQAIKLAINSDTVLNKLLVATDGPANTLVVTSLIDGVQAVGNLGVAFTAAAVTDITAADVAGFNAVYGTAHADATALQGVLVGVGGGVTTLLASQDYTAALGLDASTTSAAGALQVSALAVHQGLNSVVESDNTVTGGAGDDIIVLGSSANMDEVLVYSGVWGNDTIVNFAANGNDKFNFKSYLTNLDVTTLAPTDTVATTFLNAAAAKTAIGANTIAVVDYAALAAAADAGVFTGVTYANLSVTNVTAALNATGAGAATFAANADAVVEKVLFIIAENTAGTTATLGNAKVYSADAVISSANFANVTLLGSIDLSDTSVNALTAANFM